MNREIKFKCWLPIMKYMIHPGEFHLNSNGKVVSIQNNGTITENDNAVLLQFTGLKDKNGIEIYEGDVLKVENCYQPTFIVKYSPPHFCLYDGKDGVLGDFSWEDFETGEVIGNIFEKE